MINCKHLTKQFDNKIIIHDFSFDFPKRGLIALVGPSGCGKSTLLNIISGLLKPEGGEVLHNQNDLYSLSDSKLSFYRLKHFGFVFQDFKLFESESIINNVSLPLESLTNISKKEKIRRCEDLLYLTGINEIKNQKISKLSGGEKQRVAICRALINNPDVIFADEPTGSLDENNAHQVMEILRKVSTNSLVIVVSHDLSLMKEFANQIIYLEDGKIVDVENLKETGDKEYLPIKQGKQRLKKISIPSSFLFHHSYSKMKGKPWRNLICNFTMSLSLVGVGVAISLTSIISNNIKSAYGAMMGENRILINNKNTSIEKYGVYSIEDNEAHDIYESYQADLDGVGIIYHNDFENMFPNANEFHLLSNGKNIYLDSLSVRDINEFYYLPDYTKTFYPSRPQSMNNDEIVLGLTIQMIEDICFHLNIQRGVTSLSNYLTFNTIDVVLEVENVDWGYYTESIFALKAFSLEKNSCIYHMNLDFNSSVFEIEMGLPTTSFISGTPFYPWSLKKIYYLRSKNEPEQFLKHIFYDDKYSSYLFEIANKTYIPNFIKNKDVEDKERLLIFHNYGNGVSIRATNSILEVFKGVESPIFISGAGYMVYPNAFLSGFSLPTFFSPSEDKAIEIVDSLTTLNPNGKENVTLPDHVLNGYFSNSLSEGVTLMVDNSIKYKDARLYQIGISSKMAMTLFDTTNVVGRKIYVSANNQKDYVIKELEIIEVVNSSSNHLYQTSEWSILFFQCELGTSIFSLSPYYVSFLVNDGQKREVVKNGSKLYKDIEFYDPLEDFNLGVDEACGYIKIILLVFSLMAIVVSILLLITCIYLHVIDNQKDIGLARCLGIPKIESTKFLFSYAIIIALISFISASFDLILFSFLSNYVIGSIFGTGFTFSLNLLSLIVMFALALGVAFITSLFFSFKITKLNPLESLKK